LLPSEYPYEERKEKTMKEGHGHVFKRDDGLVAKCGGPGLCKVCDIDQTRLDAVKAVFTPAIKRKLMQIMQTPDSPSNLTKAFDEIFSEICEGMVPASDMVTDATHKLRIAATTVMALHDAGTLSTTSNDSVAIESLRQALHDFGRSNSTRRI
jgi:hypothetical protein